MINPRYRALIIGTLTAAFASIQPADAGETVAPAVKGAVVCNSYNTDRSADAEKRQYVSAVFQTDAVDTAALTTAFRRYLQTQYHVQDGATCRTAGQAQMTESAARTYEQGQWGTIRAQGFKVIETGWAYTAAEDHFTYICTANAARWTGTRAVNVFARATNPIEIPTAAALELSNAWTVQLKQTHPELQRVQAGCIRMVAEDAAARQKRLQAMDQESAGPASGWELIHVDWSFAPSGTPKPATAKSTR